MDKRLLLQELYDSIDSRKHFIKVIKQSEDNALSDCTMTLRQLEVEGKVMYSECEIYRKSDGNLIRMRGWIK